MIECSRQPAGRAATVIRPFRTYHMQPLAQPLDDLEPHYDAVVVGSGYGGGVAASRLARCGQSVCVLERGKEFLTGDFPDRFPDIRRELHLSKKTGSIGTRDALFHVNIGRHIHVLTGCGLGGGSLINAAVAMRPDARVFLDPAWPDAIAGDKALDEGFSRAERMLRPTVCPDVRALTKYQALDRASAALAARPHAAPIAVNFTATDTPSDGGQPACTLCGDCCTGCNVGAKNTIALTYLPDARAHGAAMFTGVDVSHIERADDTWRIWFASASANPKNKAAANRSVTARLVVLAAGTLGSTGILLRSREQGLSLSDRLGHGFSTNGDIIAFGYGADEPVNAIGVGHPAKVDVDPVGPTVAGQIRLADGDRLENEMYVQEGAMPSGLAPLLPMAFIPGGRLLGAAQSLIKGVYKGPFANLHTFFVVSHDDACGQIVLRNGSVDIDWPEIAEQDVYARVDDILEQIVQANGARYVKNPLAAIIGSKPATAHPLGGCGMGDDAGSGVVNHKGQVFDTRRDATADVHDGLYVCDGAVMPRSLGVNPLYTITGLAERAMIHLARDRKWRFDDQS